MDRKPQEGARRKSIEIFCCYAHKDRFLLLELKNHLAPLQRQKFITLWANTDIHAGADWEKEIHHHLNTAEIILLFVSPVFMASDYCYSAEMQRALERHESKGAQVIPIILRPVDWQGAPFSKLQMLPTGAIPVTSKKWRNRDEAFLDIAEGIRKVINQLEERGGAISDDAQVSFPPQDAGGETASVVPPTSFLAQPRQIHLPLTHPSVEMPPPVAQKSQQSSVFDPISVKGEPTPLSPNIPVSLASQLPLAPPLLSPTPGPVFLFNMPHLPDIGEFYGRAREREELISNTRNGSSTSLVGPRRIGKTWLIDYVKLIAPTALGVDFKFATLDGTQPKSKSVSAFTAKVLDAFGTPQTSSQTRLDLDALEHLVEKLKAEHIRPVLCIDEFEGFFNREAFDCDFFGGLRYLSQNGLVMIIASKHPLIDLIGERCMMTSGLFNVFEQHTLKPFNDSEAEEFARMKSGQAGFTPHERAALMTYGQDGQQTWPPLRLQLVGKMLLTDKRLAEADKSGYYRPDDQAYWHEFEQRLEEMYRGVVR